MAAGPFGEGFGISLGVQDRFSQPLAKFATSIARSRSAATALTTGLRSSAMRLGIFAIGIAATGYAFSKAMKPGIEFERQMREVSAVTGATGKEFVKMTNLAKKLGIETVFSAKESSEAMYQLGSRGIKTAQHMEALLEPSMDLAAALKFDLPQATAMTLGALNMFDMQANQSREVVDLLTNAYKNSAANAEKLAVSMQYVGPSFANMGYSLKQALPPLMLLYDLEIEASMAGTALRQAILALDAPTASAAQGLANLGLSLEDVSPRMHSFEDIVRTLGETANFESESVNIFGKRAGPIMEMMIRKGADALADYEEQLGVTGSAAETAAEQLKGLPGALVLIKSSIESVWIALEELFAPSLEESVKWVTEGINAFLLWLQASEKMKVGIQDFIKAYSSMVRDWLKPSIVYIRDIVTNVMAAVGTWNKFSESQKAFVIAGAKTGLVLTALVSAVAILGPVVMGLGKALLILNTPMLSVLGVVAALGIGVALLWAAWESNWGNIQEKVEKVWEAIKARDWKALADILVMPTLKWVGKQFANLAGWMRDVLGLPEDTEKDIWEWTAITTTIPFLAELVWKGIANVAGTVKDWVIENMKIEKIKQLVVKVADFLIELPDPVKWFFKVGTRIWEYATLGYGIWWAAKGLLSAIKFAPIALPALLPIIIGIGLALVGLDVLGSKLKGKLEEEDIEGLLEEFSKTHPLGMKLAVAIEGITGLEAPLILAYIDEKWDTVAEKLSLIVFQGQILLDIVFDIDIQSMVDSATEAIKAKFPTLIEQLGLLLFQIIIPLKIGFDIEFGAIGDKIKEFLLWPTKLWREEKPEIEEVAKEMAITINSVADLIDTDALFIALIALTERGVEGYELGVGEFSKKANIDRWNENFATLDRETLKGQIAAASISIESYWGYYKEKYSLEAGLKLKDAGKEVREDFIKYMGPGYAPTKNVEEWVAKLNKNWIPNMIRWMNVLGPLMEKWGYNTLGEFVKGLEKAAPGALTDTEKAILEVLKPMVTESPGYYPYRQWGMNTAEEFSDGVVAGLEANEAAAEQQSKSFFDVILGSLEGMMLKLVEVLKKVPGIGPFIEEIEGIIAVFGEAKEEADELADKFTGMLGGVTVSARAVAGTLGKVEVTFSRWGIQVGETIKYLAKVSKAEEAVMLKNWNKFLKSQLLSTYKTYQDLAGYMSALTDEQKDKLGEQYDNWISTYGDISKEVETFYSRLEDFASSSFDAISGMLSNLKGLFSDLLGPIGGTIGGVAELGGAIWAAIKGDLEGVVSSLGGILTSLSSVFFDLFKNTEAYSAIQEALTPILDALNPIFEELGEMFARDIIPLLKDVVAGFVPIFASLLPILETVATVFLKVVTALLPLIDVILKSLTPIFEGLAPVVVTVAEILGSTLTPILEALSPLFNAIGWLLENVVNPVFKTIGEILEWTLVPIVNTVSAAFETIGLVFRTVATMVAGIWNALAKFLNWLLGWLGVKIPLIEIPKYKMGTPFVPETGLAVVHKGERITPAGQNRGSGDVGRAGNGTQITYERGSIKMIVMGGINQQVDLEKAMDYLVQKQAESMARI